MLVVSDASPVNDPGERAAITLAHQLRPDYLLIDEKRGRRTAVALRIVGTIGTLELAAARDLIDLRDALTRIRQTDFSISDDILKAALERDDQRRRPDQP